MIATAKLNDNFNIPCVWKAVGLMNDIDSANVNLGHSAHFIEWQMKLEMTTDGKWSAKDVWVKSR